MGQDVIDFMRVVSLVPSWTETLIEAGIEVVGRTRFCIHPASKIRSVPAVGGTKNVDWELIKKLKPDLVLMDKEENPREFAENCPFPWHATHVVDIQSCATELGKLGQLFSNQALSNWAAEFDEVLKAPEEKWDFNRIPGEIEKLGVIHSPQSVLYVIWKTPWMCVTRHTYIGSVLEFLGAPLAELKSESKYPEISEDELKKHYVLFSSEPFPFVKKKKDLELLGLAGSLVDGEKYSWFGIRGLNFLKQVQNKFEGP
jgi:ABC-type Fe3+-hydroxamate transport system substrate-binding protein